VASSLPQCKSRKELNFSQRKLLRARMQTNFAAMCNL
jgi:hypothetical protein